MKKLIEETDKGRLECLRNLSWYSADVDISKIMEYLSETDSIDVKIYGETRPIREVIREGREIVREGTPDENDFDYAIKNESTGVTTYYFYPEYEGPEIDYYEYEKQTFRKQDGKVVIDNEHPDEERGKSSNLGIPEMLTYQIAYPESAHEDEENGDVDTLDFYIKYIAQQFAGNDEFIPYVQDFIYEVLDPDILRDMTNEEYNRFSNRIEPDEKTLAKIAGIREQFKTVESTKSYLERVKMQNPETEKQNKHEKRLVPNFIANMSKRDINSLGGLDNLLKLVEVKGEDSAKEILSLLGYEINDGLTQEGSSLEDLEFESSALKERERQAEKLYQQYEEQLPDKNGHTSIGE